MRFVNFKILVLKIVRYLEGYLRLNRFAPKMSFAFGENLWKKLRSAGPKPSPTSTSNCDQINNFKTILIFKLFQNLKHIFWSASQNVNDIKFYEKKQLSWKSKRCGNGFKVLRILIFLQNFGDLSQFCEILMIFVILISTSKFWKNLVTVVTL